MHLSQRALGSAKHCLKAHGVQMKQLAVGLDRGIARSNSALAAGAATIGQAAHGQSVKNTAGMLVI